MNSTLAIGENGDRLMKDIVGWDVKTWSEALKFWEQVVEREGIGLKCLEIGAGSGGLSLWLVLRGRTVICSNNRDSEERASDLHTKYSAGASIEYQDIDATNIPYENYFDVIVFKSVLGGIGRNNNKTGQQEAVNEIYKALKPGGRLFFAENHSGTIFHKLARGMAWALRRNAYWRYVSIAEMKEFLANWSRYEIHTTGVIAVFGLTEWQRKLLSYTDQLILNRLLPESWRYVIYGTAIK